MKNKKRHFWNKRDDLGKFATKDFEIVAKRKKFKLYVICILGIAFILTLAVIGGYWVLIWGKERVIGLLWPKATVEAQILPKTPYEIICKATNGENCDVIYNLCTKESGKFVRTDQEKCQKWAVGKNTDGTFDFSWLQINDVHIIGRPTGNEKDKSITMECVYDLPCVAQWANKQIKKGNGHIWSTWEQI